MQKATSDADALKTKRLPNVDLKVLSGSLLGPLKLTFGARVHRDPFPSTGPIPAKENDRRQQPDAEHGALCQRRAAVDAALDDQLGRQGARRRRGSGPRAGARAGADRPQPRADDLLRTAPGRRRPARRTADTRGLYVEIDRLVTDYIARQLVLPAESLSVKTMLARLDLNDITLRNTIATLKEQLNIVMGRSVAIDFSVIAGPTETAFEVDPAVWSNGSRSSSGPTSARRGSRRSRPNSISSAAPRRLGPRSAWRWNTSASTTSRSCRPTSRWPASSAAGSRGTGAGRNTRTRPSNGRSNRLASPFRKPKTPSASTTSQNAIGRCWRSRAPSPWRTSGAQDDREKLRVATERFRLEASLQRQVLEAQAGLADADQQFQQALSAFWSARGDFDKAVGGGGQ